MRIVNDKFIFPLFFLIDTSQSMGWPADNTDSSKTSATRIDAANQLLPAIIDICDSKPTLQSRIRLELIPFNETAEVAIPLCKYQEFTRYKNYRFDTNWQTRYSEDFHLLYDELKHRMDNLQREASLAEIQVNTPVVFFLTDGKPEGDDDERINEWWSKISADDFEHRPNFISIGVCQEAEGKLSKYQCGNHGNYYIDSDPSRSIAMIEKFIDAVQYSISSIKSGAGTLDDAFFRDFDERMRRTGDPDDLLSDL